MVPETCQSKRLRIGDEQPQHPFSRGAWPDLRLFLGAKPDGDELGQRRLVVVEHSERTVASAGHRTCLLNDVTQERGQFEVLFDEQDGIENPAEPGRVFNRVVGHDKRLRC